MPRNQNPPVLRTSSLENGGLRFPPFFKGGLGWILNFSYKSLFIIFFFLLIGIVALSKFYPQNKISAAWWNDGWGYRKAVSISNTSGSTLTNQRVKITIDTATLYSAGKIQINCNDLRVTDSTGKLMDHWVTGCNTSSTSVYVKISSLPTTDTSLYIYYGSPSASNIETTLGTSSNPGTSCKMMKDQSSVTQNGLYYVVPGGNDSDIIQVYCDTTTTTGDWTMVIQNSSYATPPKPTWSNAINSVNISGALSTTLTSFDLLLGLKHWNYLGNTALIQMGSDPNTITKRAHYSSISLNASNSYQLSLSGQTIDLGGTAPGFYSYHNGQKFTTYDSDNDTYGANCAASYSNTAWWYGSCWSGNIWGGGDVGGYQNKPFWVGSSADYHNYGAILIGGTDTMKNTTVNSLQSEEQSTAPVAYWKFDEGIGTTAYDSTSNVNHGIFGTGNSAPTWQTEDQCISGKCLYFNGNNYVKLNSSTNANVVGDISVSVWVKPKNPESQGVIIHKDYQYSLIMYADKTVAWADSSNWSYSNFAVQDIGIQSGKWNYITVTKTGGVVKIYLNGIQKVSKSFGSSISSTSNTMLIGCYGASACASGFFSGFIDEPKIYPYARTVAQVKLDYAAGKAHSSSTKGTSANLGSSNQNLSALSDGLVGYWSFNEGSGTTTVDSSGNNNTATLGTGNSAPTWSPGKYGVGLSFNGTTTFASTTSGPNLSDTLTFSLWLKTPTSDSPLVNYPLSLGNSGTVRLSLRVGGSYSTASSAAYSIGLYDGTNASSSVANAFKDATDANTWHNIIVTYDKNAINPTRIFKDGVELAMFSQGITGSLASQNQINFGRRVDNVWFWNGSIDEVRIYNRALSPSEISQLYNWAPGPIGYWNLDDNSGSTVSDKSGNNLSGTFGTGSSAPSWSVGKFGSGLNFTATGKHIKVPLGSLVSNFDTNVTNRSYSYSLWFKSNNATSGTSQYLLTNNSACNNDGNFSIYLISGNVRFGYYSTGGSTSVIHYFTPSTTLQNNQWYHLEWTKTFGQLGVKAYLNGIAQTISGDNVLTGNSNLSNIVLGAYNGDGVTCTSGVNNSPPVASRSINGAIDDIKIYNYVRSPRQVIEDMNAGHPIGGSPIGSQIAYWKFDEGYGSSTYDSSSQSNTGTLMTGTSIPTWSNSGKFNKALNFLGNDSSYVSFPDSGSSSPLDLTSSFTLSSWVKVNSFSSYATIFYKYGSFYLTINPSGALTFGGNNGTWGTKYTSSTGLITTGNWYHIVLTYDSISTKIIKLYVNGKANISVGVTSDIVPNNNALFIGRGYTGENGSLNGSIDEVKIYNTALNSNDILLDYNQGKSIVMGSKGTESDGTTNSFSAAREYCIPGDTSTCNPPVAEWKMDEGVGTTAYDTSGNNLHGVLGTGNSSPTWVQGKTGSGLSYSGNDKVLVADNSLLKPTSAITVESWFNTSDKTVNQRIISKTEASGYQLSLNENGACTTNTLCFVINIGSTYYQASYPVSNLSNNTWYHASGNYDGSTVRLYLNGLSIGTTSTVSGAITQGAYPVCIGSEASSGTCISPFFTGKIDLARVYNYARTPAQISWDYNRGKPVAWWKFDECQGTAIGDWSMNGNTGTLNIGASGTQNSVGTCSVGTSAAWTNGASGKQNSSMNFDGTDDTATLSFSINNYTQITYSAWVKINGNPSTTQYSVVTGNYGRSGIYINTTGKARARAWNASDHFVDSTTSVTDNQWHHIVTTYNQGIPLTKIYIDGKYEGQMSYYPDIVTYSTSYIAENPNTTVDTYFKGQIDDVRIFNYALTATQIKDVYNNGAVNFSN